MLPTLPDRDDELNIAPEKTAVIISCNNYIDIFLHSGVRKVCRGTILKSVNKFRQCKVPFLKLRKSVLLNLYFVEDIKEDGTIQFSQSFCDALNHDDRKTVETLKCTLRARRNYYSWKKNKTISYHGQDDNSLITAFTFHSIACAFISAPVSVRYIYKEGR